MSQNVFQIEIYIPFRVVYVFYAVQICFADFAARMA